MEIKEFLYGENAVKKIRRLVLEKLLTIETFIMKNFL